MKKQIAATTTLRRMVKTHFEDNSEVENSDAEGVKLAYTVRAILELMLTLANVSPASKSGPTESTGVLNQLAN